VIEDKPELPAGLKQHSMGRSGRETATSPSDFCETASPVSHSGRSMMWQKKALRKMREKAGRKTRSRGRLKAIWKRKILSGPVY
jgi:hypothetical protein